MKLGVYTESLKRMATGVESVTQQLVDGMKEKHNLVCYHTKESPEIEGAENKIFRSIPLPFFNRALSFFRKNVFNNCDILHVPYPDFPYFLKPNTKVAVTVHDITPVTHPQFHTWKRKFYFKYLLPYYLKRVDKIIASSDATKEAIVKNYGIEPEKIERVYLGVNIEKYGSGEKGDYILYLGTLEPRKNVEGVIIT